MELFNRPQKLLTTRTQHYSRHNPITINDQTTNDEVTFTTPVLCIQGLHAAEIPLAVVIGTVAESTASNTAGDKLCMDCI